MKRGTGYCKNERCRDYLCAIFLVNHSDIFNCPRCLQEGLAEGERGFVIGGPGQPDIFREVRVEFDFDPDNQGYRQIAVVCDESLWGRCNTYVLQTPTANTETRALKMAEAILANLNRYRGLLNGDDIPRTTEIILSFDANREDFSLQLSRLEQEWSTGAQA